MQQSTLARAGSGGTGHGSTERDRSFTSLRSIETYENVEMCRQRVTEEAFQEEDVVEPVVWDARSSVPKDKYSC